MTKRVASLAVLAAAAILSTPAVLPVAVSAAPRSSGEGGQVDGAAFQARLDRAWQYHKLSRILRDSLAPPQWLADGNRFVYWAASGPNAGTWAIVDARTGQQEPVLAAADLKAQLSAITGHEVILQGKMPFALQSKENRIVFQNADRAFAVNLDSHRVSAIAADDAAGQPGAIPSADGNYTLLASPGGFSVVDSRGRAVLGRSGEGDVHWDVTPDSWSPDGRHLLAMRIDDSDVHKIPIVDYSAVETVKMVPYSKTGTPLPRVKFHLIDVTTGTVTPLPAIEGEGYSYIAGWRPDGAEALVMHLSRDGKRLDLIGFNAATFSSRIIVREERPKTFVGALDFATITYPLQVKPLDDKHFVWMSERDGWRHAYLYNWSGKLERQLTRGRYVVEQVLGTSPARRDVLVVASADGPRPYDRKLYRVPLSGGQMTLVSKEPGDQQVSLSPDGEYYTVGYSTYSQPRRVLVGRTSGGDPIQYSQADASRLFELGYVPPEPFTATTPDGATKLYGIIFKPADFDPTKHYPVIEMIYAGPFITIVPRGFVGSSAELGLGAQVMGQALAQMGFVVVLVDGRGTPGRSKAFQDFNYGRVGQTEIPEHVAAIRQAAASRPYMDLNRVGVFGHSWGGYFATRAMLVAPDFYKAGYSGAEGMLEEEAVINEPNMDLPSKNPQGYEAGSNVRLAGNLRGAFKMMHGTSDVNATLSTTMRMADALIKAGKQFDLLIMPGAGHWPPPSTERYYVEDVERFFVRHLGQPS